MKGTIISVVTPSFNQGQFLAETIASVLNQEGDFYIDYIIMDGGSRDESVKIIQKYAFEVAAQPVVTSKGRAQFRSYGGCLGVSYRWVSRKDRGQSDAVRKGFEEAEGHVFGWLNSDDTYYPGALQAVLSVKWEDFCYGRGMWTDVRNQPLLEYPVFHPYRTAMYYECVLCQPAVFFSRDAYFKTGGIDSSFRNSFDYEFWIRAVSCKKHWRKIPKLLAASRMYQENKTLSEEKRVQSEVAAIRKKYFQDLIVPVTILNKLKLHYFVRTVHKKTVEKVQELHCKLKNDCSEL